MANIKQAFGTSNQAITITINSLAASATVGRASTAVDNSSNLFLDALVQVIIVNAGSAPTGNKCVFVYAYGTADGGTTYSDSITGTDAGFTRTDPTNLTLIGVVNAPTASITYKSRPMAVAVGFGGVLPEKWGIAVFNDTGQTLSTGCSAFYQGVYATSV